MYTFDNLRDDIINLYKDNNILSCAYFEKNYTNYYEDIHLYLVLNDKNITFRDLNNELDIINLLDKKTNIYFKKLYNWDKSLHIITIEKISIHIHLVDRIYNFEDVNIIFNNDLEIKEDSNNIFQMTIAIKDFISDLNYCYRMNICNNKYLGLLYINKLYNDLIHFLSNFYLDYYVYKEDIHLNFDNVLKKMPKDKKNKFNEIIKKMNIDTTIDALKLIIWFFDEFIINLPIMVMQAIDIDLYNFIKEIILK